MLELGPPQVAQLQSEFPELERIQVEAAWFGVVMDWCEDPSAPQTETDGGYFYSAARRRLRNLVASESARRAREKRWSRERPTEQPGTRIPPEEAIAAADVVVRLGEKLAEQVPAFLKPDEKLVYRLWLGGERRTEVFAEALGVPESMPVKEQRLEDECSVCREAPNRRGSFVSALQWLPSWHSLSGGGDEAQAAPGVISDQTAGPECAECVWHPDWEMPWCDPLVLTGHTGCEPIIFGSGCYAIDPVPCVPDFSSLPGRGASFSELAARCSTISVPSAPVAFVDVAVGSAD